MNNNRHNLEYVSENQKIQKNKKCKKKYNFLNIFYDGKNCAKYSNIIRFSKRKTPIIKNNSWYTLCIIYIIL